MLQSQHQHHQLQSSLLGEKVSSFTVVPSLSLSSSSLLSIVLNPTESTDSVWAVCRVYVYFFDSLFFLLCCSCFGRRPFAAAVAAAPCSRRRFSHHVHHFLFLFLFFLHPPPSSILMFWDKMANAFAHFYFSLFFLFSLPFYFHHHHHHISHFIHTHPHSQITRFWLCYL